MPYGTPLQKRNLLEEKKKGPRKEGDHDLNFGLGSKGDLSFLFEQVIHSLSQKKFINRKRKLMLARVWQRGRRGRSLFYREKVFGFIASLLGKGAWSRRRALR